MMWTINLGIYFSVRNIFSLRLLSLEKERRLWFQCWDERSQPGSACGGPSQALPAEAPDLNPAAEFCQREAV